MQAVRSPLDAVHVAVQVALVYVAAEAVAAQAGRVEIGQLGQWVPSDHIKLRQVPSVGGYVSTRRPAALGLS